MPVLDMKTFNELKENTGEDFILELLNAFYEDTTKQMGEMRSAVSAGDAETFRRAAHSLKSNAATFGAKDLSALARELEMMGRDQNLAVGNRLDALKEAFDLVKRQLSELR